MLAIVIGIVNIGLAALFVALALPLLHGKVKRNVFYGVRLHESLRSEEAWLAINRHGARRMIICALPIAAIGVVSFFLPLTVPWGFALLFPAPLALVVTMLDCHRYGRVSSA